MSSNIHFTNLVKKSKVKQPTQKGFSLRKWKDSYNKSFPYNEKDENLYKAGIWFFRKLNVIREKLKEISDNSSEKQTLLRLYIGFINREYTVVSEDMKNVFQKTENLISAGELIEQKSSIGLQNRKINSESAIEAIVSAIRYPLSDIYNKQKYNDKFQNSDLELINKIGLTANLAIHYDIYSDYWSECLWNDWVVQENEFFDNIIPPHSKKYMAQTLSRHRIGSLLIELSWRAFTSWTKLPTPLKDEINNQKIITKVIVKKGKRKLKVGHNGSCEGPPFSFLAEIAVEEIYWNELLIEPLPNFNNVTIREILTVFRVLSSLGEIVENTIPKDTSVESINKLLQYSPKFQRNILEIAIIQATKLSGEKVSAALDILTFKKTPREDTWFTPIIPLVDGEISFNLPALKVPNMIRSVEYWMKIGGLNLDKRGFLYEEKFIQDIKQCCQTTRYFKNAKIDSGKFKLERGEEEIDFVFIFGNTVLIGEIKCSIFPASPIENYHLYKIIEGASEQADRKSKFIKKHIKEFSNRYKDHNFTDLNEVNVIPLVIVNLHHGVGVPINDVPVIDSFILKNFLKGKQDFFIEVANDGSTKSSTTKTFYSSLEEAEANIYNYLRNPPVFSIMSKMIDKEFIQLLKIEDEDKAHGLTRLYVNESKKANLRVEQTGVKPIDISE